MEGIPTPTIWRNPRTTRGRVKAGEFPKINPELMFKALGGLFMGLVFMGDKKEPVSEKDVEKLLNQLITDPNYSSN